MNQHQVHVGSVSQLLQIKTNFINRNRLMVTGLMRFLVGPLLALIVMHDNVRRTLHYESLYSVLFVVVWLLFAYLTCSLIFDVIAYLSPLPKVTLSNAQMDLLQWPLNYPAELIETPQTTVIQDELQKRREQQSTLSPQPNQTSHDTIQPSTTHSAVPSTPLTSHQTSSATPIPAFTHSSPANTSFYSTPYKTATTFPITPLPHTPALAQSPFTLSPYTTPGPTPTTQYPQTPYSFSSPQQNFTPQPNQQPQQQQNFSSPQQSFSSPYPSTPAPAYGTPYPNATPQSTSNFSPAYTPMAVSPMQFQPSPLSASQVVSPSGGASLRRSRFGFANPEITTEGSLRRYVDSVKASAEKKVPTSGSMGNRPFLPTNSPTPQLPKYRPSYNHSDKLGGPSTTQRVTHSPPTEPPMDEDVYAYQLIALQTLQEQGLSNKIESCIERMQEWLGSRLIPYVIKFVDLYLARSEPQNAQQWNIFQGHIQAYLDMSQFGFTQPNSADYIANRVKELNYGAVLSKYNWSRGSDGESNNMVWDSRYPCDAQVIMHMFCTFLDLHLLADPTRTSGKPFTSKYFARTPAFPSNYSHPVIFQKSNNPPHFELVLPLGKLWPVQLGYNNLCVSLVCFLYQISKNYSGYLGPISLADPEISLSWVVEELSQ